jgi:cold shock CspA family protein
MRGTVTTYFQSKGYGFITYDDDGASRFFHSSNYSGVPKLGTRVEFALAEPTKIGKDKQCVNVTPIEAESAGGGVQ